MTHEKMKGGQRHERKRPDEADDSMRSGGMRALLRDNEEVIVRVGGRSGDHAAAVTGT